MLMPIKVTIGRIPFTEFIYSVAPFIQRLPSGASPLCQIIVSIMSFRCQFLSHISRRFDSFDSFDDDDSTIGLS